MKTSFKAILLMIIFLSLQVSVKTDWVNVTHEINNLNVNALTATGNYIFAGNDQYVYRSSNNGDNWQQIYNLNALALASSGSYIYQGYQNGVGRSTNYGANWSGAGLGQWTLSLLAESNYVYAGCFWPTNSTNKGVWVSNNYGANWFHTSLNDKNIYTFTVSDGYLFAGGDGLYLSTNNGTNWSLSLLMSIWALTSNGNNIFVGTDGTPYGVYRSTNYGTNWTQTSLNNVGIHALAIYGNNVFAAGGFWVSTDSGISWTERAEGMPYYVNELCIFNGFVFAGTDGMGVFRRPLNEIVGVEKISETVPGAFTLKQNYPNPFNSQTTIEFEIPKRDKYSLEIIDILGRNVDIPFEGLLESGNYKINYNAGKLASGVYFYSLKSENYTGTKKFVLIK